MNFLTTPIVYMIALVVGMAACLFIGNTIGRKWQATAGDRKPTFGAIDGAVFALYGLLIAFTFNGAPARLEKRAYLATDEANAIETAYLRLDLLRADLQPPIRQKFRDYVDSRIRTYRLLPDVEAAEQELAISEDLQKQIWGDAMSAFRQEGSHTNAAQLLVPTLNTMFDVANTRTTAAMIHPPHVVYGMLVLLSYLASTLAGFGMSGTKHSWLHSAAFVLITGITVFAIFQMEYPWAGFLNMREYETIFFNLRDAMQ